MSLSEVQNILNEIEDRLATADISDSVVQQAVEDLLNLVEQLVVNQQNLQQEVQRLREQLEQKKKAKSTAATVDDGDQKSDKDHSSEKRRRKRRPPQSPQAPDRRSFKKLTVHEEIPCPVDPDQLPADAQRLEDEPVVIQDIEIKPRNIRFQRHVYYSPSEKKYYRGPLPEGYGGSAFGPDLRALILSLKYCGNMSEPKIREFLDNFDVQISAGSVSNILTGLAESFESEFHDVLMAGLASTSYQQTDDTSARVGGQSWHTHILCNPFYTAYFTRPHKDRLTVLSILQNTELLQFRFNERTLQLLKEPLEIPIKWQQRVAAWGEDVVLDAASLKALLDSWFGKDRQTQTRTYIEQAGAIVYYQQQTAVPVVSTLVCDDAGQFKLITDRLALCWIHEGRHYERLSPMVSRHADLLDQFAERYWDYYALLQRYRQEPHPQRAKRLRLEFDELFSTRTGYAALDDRIAKTAAKKDELLTVLSDPDAPLHNNASELGARVSARRRDVSLHSKSVRGALAMDIFTTIVQTSKKLGVCAYQYFRDRISGHFELPSLSDRIQDAVQNSHASG